MRRLLTIFFLFTGTLLWSQSFNNEVLLRRANLDEDQIRAVIIIEEEYAALKRETLVEQNFYKAQLERLLLRSDPDMDEVEDVLRNSLEWKLKETMAEIERRVEIRKIVGEEKWAKLIRYLTEIRQRNAEQKQN